jgi:phage tail-like protein
VSATIGQLIVRLGETVVQIAALNAPVITIGRAPDNTVSLIHSLVSRRHAEIRLAANGPIIVDLGSANGTSVDGERLLAQQPLALLPGAVMTIGPYTLTYQMQGANEPAEAVEPVEVAEAAVALQALPSAPPGTMLPALPVVRAEYPVVRAQGPISPYLHDLPIIYHDNDFLARFLLIFESIWEPLEQRQDHIAMYADPHTSPASFLGWLGGWLDLSFSAQWPENRTRRLVAEAVDLYRWRGTEYGMTRMIEVCTGLSPRITGNAAEPFVFRITVTAPRDGAVDRDLVEQLIVAHKPAHAGYRLEFST